MLQERDVPQPAPEPADVLAEHEAPAAVPALAVPAIASAAAAVLHATAAGIHADHPALSRIFVAMAVAQAAVAVLAFLRQSRLVALSLVSVNAVAASGFRSELWSYAFPTGRPQPVRYGSGGDVQLWSTTDLAVQYVWARLPH